MRKNLLVLATLLVLVGCSKPKEKVEKKVEETFEVFTCTIKEKNDSIPDTIKIEHKDDVMKFIVTTITHTFTKEDLDAGMKLSDEEFTKHTVEKQGLPGLDVKRNRISDTDLEIIVRIDLTKSKEEIGVSEEIRNLKASEYIKGLEPTHTCK